MTPDHRRQLEAIEAELPNPSEQSELAELLDFLTRDEIDRVAAALDRYRLPNGSFNGVSIAIKSGGDLVDLLALAWERRAAGWSETAPMTRVSVTPIDHSMTERARLAFERATRSLQDGATRS